MTTARTAETDSEFPTPARTERGVRPVPGRKLIVFPDAGTVQWRRKRINQPIGRPTALTGPGVEPTEQWFEDIGPEQWTAISRRLRASILHTPVVIGGENLTEKGSAGADAPVLAHLKHIFSQAREDTFEDGIDSPFRRIVITLIQRRTTNTLRAITQILEEEFPSEVCYEAIRAIGDIQDSGSQQERLAFLIKILESNVIAYRDAASLAIAAMDDPEAIPALKAALEREPSDRLRPDLAAVLDQLEETARALPQKN